MHTVGLKENKNAKNKLNSFLIYFWFRYHPCRATDYICISAMSSCWFNFDYSMNTVVWISFLFFHLKSIKSSRIFVYHTNWHCNLQSTMVTFLAVFKKLFFFFFKLKKKLIKNQRPIWKKWKLNWPDNHLHIGCLKKYYYLKKKLVGNVYLAYSTCTMMYIIVYY